MNLKGYSDTCSTLERRGYGSEAHMIFEEMLRVDRVVRGPFRIDRTVRHNGLMDMIVTYDSSGGWTCKTDWLGSANLNAERLSSVG